MARIRAFSVAVVMGAALVVPFVSVGNASAPASRADWNYKKPCKVDFYRHHYCHPDSAGWFYLAVPGTPYRLNGRGSNATARSVIFVTGVAAPWRPQRARAFAVFASGPILPLHLNADRPLYRFNVATGKAVHVPAVTQGGIYEVLVR